MTMTVSGCRRTTSAPSSSRPQQRKLTGTPWRPATANARFRRGFIVIDHLGLLQPNEPPPLAEPWADLPKLLALAAYPNVRVKISGACTLSREPFPYNDIWDPVLRIIDAFGIDRCMWGTDWTRTSGMLTYEQGVAPFRNTDRLSDSDRSDSDRSKLMGETLMQVYGW